MQGLINLYAREGITIIESGNGFQATRGMAVGYGYSVQRAVMFLKEDEAYLRTATVTVTPTIPSQFKVYV